MHSSCACPHCCRDSCCGRCCLLLPLLLHDSCWRAPHPSSREALSLSFRYWVSVCSYDSTAQHTQHNTQLPELDPAPGCLLPSSLPMQMSCSLLAETTPNTPMCSGQHPTAGAHACPSVRGCCLPSCITHHCPGPAPAALLLCCDHITAVMRSGLGACKAGLPWLSCGLCWLHWVERCCAGTAALGGGAVPHLVLR
jgi:hypothetical protein